MQSSEKPTLEQETEYFKKVLKDAVELGINPKHPQMIPALILDIIFEITDAYPAIDTEKVVAAQELWDSYVEWASGKS